MKTASATAPVALLALSLLSSVSSPQESAIYLMRGGRLLSEEQLPSATSPSGIDLPSPGKAFLMSALVPGAGQLYMGQRRGWLYLAADLAAWTGYFIASSRGKDKEDAYRAYADDHYVLTRTDFANDAERGWVEWWDLFRRLDDTYIYADSIYLESIIYDHDHARASYYQDISESNAYIYGWDDWAPDPYGNNESYWGFDSETGRLYFNYLSTHRDEFQRLRDDANSTLAWTDRFIGMAVALRAVSAIDALRSARVRRTRSGLHWDVVWRKNDPVLVLGWSGCFG